MASMMMEEDTAGNLDDLVHQAEQMISEIQGESDLPRITRSLEQMHQMGERLYTRGAQSDIKAARLLGGRAGFELPGSLAHKLEALNVLRSYEGLEPAPVTDIQTFLKNERENALLAAIEQTRRRTIEESERRCDSAVGTWWEQEKQRVLNSLVGSGGTGANELRDVTAPDLEEGCAVSPQHPHRTLLTRVELHYARQVDRYISAGVNEDLCSLLADVTAGVEGSHTWTEAGGTDQVGELWRLVNRMSDLPRTASSQPDVLSVRTSRRVQTACARAAIQHLEAEFAAFMRVAVVANQREARLGGRPGSRALAKAFLTVRLPPGSQGMLAELEDETVDGKPVWPMIYLCMRCGDIQEAVDIAKAAASNLGDFPSFLEEYRRNDRSLPASIQTKVRMEYKRSVKNGTDPFKRLVYCVLGCCEPSENHPEVATSIDDFLWLRLLQLSWPDPDTSEVPAGEEVQTLVQLQKILFEDYGESYFKAWEQPLLYFKILFLSQQFEAALGFLSRFEALRCHAVHAALVLRDRRLLILPPNIQVQLVSRENGDSPGIRRLNLARLVMVYTRKFEATDPREALNYFYFLRDLRLGDQSVFFTCVAQLALESREFDLLLGRLDESGNRMPGAVDRFRVEVSHLIGHVASALELRGHLEEAVSVLQLSGDLSKAVQLAAQILAPQVPLPTNTPTRQRLIEAGTKLALLARRQPTVPSGSPALFLLLDLANFFQEAHAGLAEGALTVLDSLRLLPSDQNSVEARTRDFDRLPEEVRRMLPALLTTSMSCLREKANAIRSSELGGQSPVLSEVRNRAKALVTFAGRLPYRMPADVYARLSQMEMELM